jgi:hypothetical protein
MIITNCVLVVTFVQSIPTQNSVIWEYKRGLLNPAKIEKVTEAGYFDKKNKWKTGSEVTGTGKPGWITDSPDDLVRRIRKECK